MLMIQYLYFDSCAYSTMSCKAGTLNWPYVYFYYSIAYSEPQTS